MDALVTEHMLTPPEALATLPAGEGPRARVCFAVAHQVLTPVEGLATLAARMRLLARWQERLSEGNVLASKGFSQS